jgi:hypothetical protein
MGNSRRLHEHKQRGMTKRIRLGKKPMSKEQKADRKKKAEIDRARTKASLEKKKLTK